jgi:hypothetical protein
MSDNTLPPGWTKSYGLYVHDQPRMYVRRAGPRRKWLATARLGGVDWHSYEHKTARDAMRAANTLAALFGELAEAEKRGMERAATLIEAQEEAFRTGSGTFALQPRTPGNLAGLSFAAAIRAEKKARDA